ncbi:MAG: MmgE/PrpD family protein [Clostridia bacterium]|nr:MmgE/PrpD family protein [Clostridia bacterium]
MSTKQLTDFLSDIRFEDLSAHTVDYAKLCVIDLMGAAIAGSENAVGRIWSDYFAAGSGANGRIPMWRKGFHRADTESAAAYNAACSHLLDVDDVHNTSITHPGTITIPAALAIGEEMGASGRDVIAAIAAGYEAAARIGQAINPGAYWFWHTTGVCGAYASAAAAGKLLGLSKEQMLQAFGSAGTQAAGLWEFLDDGSMSKSLHTANGTLCGIRSARLAKLGFTGASKILEGKKGFLKALNPEADEAAITRGLEKGVYELDNNSFKPYACCRHIHSANYAILQLIDEYGIKAGDVDRIVDKTYQVAINTASNEAPKTPYAYKFSIQYCLAAALLYGEVSGNVFTPEKTGSPEARALMDSIDVVLDPAIQKGFEEDPARWTHTLEVSLKDGRVLKKTVDYPLGDSRNPFSWDIAESKFHGLADPVIGRKAADRLAENIKKLDTFEDAGLLFDGIQ